LKGRWAKRHDASAGERGRGGRWQASDAKSAAAARAGRPRAARRSGPCWRRPSRPAIRPPRPPRRPTPGRPTARTASRRHPPTATGRASWRGCWQKTPPLKRNTSGEGGGGEGEGHAVLRPSTPQAGNQRLLLPCVAPTAPSVPARPLRRRVNTARHASLRVGSRKTRRSRRARSAIPCLPGPGPSPGRRLWGVRRAAFAQAGRGRLGGKGYEASALPHPAYPARRMPAPSTQSGRTQRGPGARRPGRFRGRCPPRRA
jgi:hypothetical protein